MKAALPGAVLAMAMALAPPALADPDYSSESVVEHFSSVLEQRKKAPAAGVRSVVIGTGGFSEQDSAGPDDERFNLLITFEYNSDRLTVSAQRNLDEFAAALRHPTLRTARFAVEGHTDATGSDAYNQELSERRALAAIDYLVSKGIPRDRLLGAGYGESRLKGERPDDPINRRVEARLLE